VPKGQVGERRRLAAIMFTDMVGYTALGQRNESLSLALVNEQRNLLRPIFKRHHGREIKTIGDAFLAEFPSALDATRCAYDIQRATREFNFTLPEGRRIVLRIGLHLGDVVESGNGDISGDAVNVASRIEPIAEHEGVCLTRQVYDHVRNKFEVPLQSLGFKALKNVSEPLEVFKMVMPWHEHGLSVQPSADELDKRRVAVLPFSNMSPDPNDEYFADGMTEELISAVSLIPELSVISRTSVMSYKKTLKEKKTIDIGRELNIGTILEGSVRKAGSRVRISVQLIDVQSDKHLWVQNYERELQDLFAVQSDVAQRVASTLKLKLLGGGLLGQIERRGATNSKAYSLYLQGIYERGILERTYEDWKRAINYFERAIESDPKYAPAYAGLADCYEELGQDIFNPSEVYPKAKAFAEKALALDDSLPEAHHSLATLLYRYYWDRPGAEREFKRALELNPNSVRTHELYSDFLITAGNFDQSLEHVNRSIELDPLSLEARGERARLFALTGRYDDAIAECNQVLDLDPSRLSNYEWLSIAYAGKQMFDEALDAARKLLPLYKGTIAKAIQAVIYFKLGDHAMVEKIQEDMLKLSKEEYISPAILALLYNLVGDTEKSFDELQKALEIRSPHLIYLRSHQFYFGVFRSDVRFQKILDKVGLPEG
jgi:adenylate cyclase